MPWDRVCAFYGVPTLTAEPPSSHYMSQYAFSLTTAPPFECTDFMDDLWEIFEKSHLKSGPSNILVKCTSYLIRSNR